MVGAERWGNQAGINASTSAGIVRTGGSRQRLPCPGNWTAQTSTHEGSSAGHKRKIAAAPPACEKQNVRIAGRCNQPLPVVLYVARVAECAA
jgi:hypothetical protein